MKFQKLSLIAVSALLFVGCSNTPDDAVSNMYEALKEGNSVKLADNAEEAMSISLMSESLKNCNMQKKEDTDDMSKINECLKQKYENLKYKNIETEKISQDSAYVKVIIIQNDIQNDITLNVKKIDGKWMVMGRKKQ